MHLGQLSNHVVILGDVFKSETLLKQLFSVDNQIGLWMAFILQLVSDLNRISEMFGVLSSWEQTEFFFHWVDFWLEYCLLEVWLDLDGSLGLCFDVGVTTHDGLAEVVGIPVVVLGVLSGELRILVV